MKDFLIHVGIGLLGVVLYNVFVFRKHLSNPSVLSTKTFWNAYLMESKFMWIWSCFLLIIVSAIVYISPETSESIKQLTGLDIADSLSAYFTFGLGVCSLANTKTK